MSAVQLFRRFSAVLALACLLFAAGCTDDSFFSYNGDANSGNFSTTVFLGDSYTAGFMNGSLCDKFQPNSWPALVAKQAGFTINQPLVASPGAPNYYTLALGSYTVPTNFGAFDNTYTNAVTQVTGTTTGRDSATLVPTNLAVPGATVSDIVNTKPVANPTTTQQLLTSYVLGAPLSGKSQMNQAIAQNPTTIIIWAGVDDALLADTGNNGAASVGSAAMPNPSTFLTNYTNLLTAITSVSNAHIILLNVPDVTQLPYMTSGASLSTSLGTTAFNKLGMASGDLINATGAALIPSVIGGSKAASVLTPYIMKAADVVTVQNNIGPSSSIGSSNTVSYNSVINGLASEIGATVVDMNLAFSTWQTTPPTVTISGTTYTPSFGYLGGLFSTDGIHPTATFQAFLANRVIDASNSKMGTSITKLTGANIGVIAAADPLFGPNIGKVAF
jgi:hypothetical protein